MNASELDMLVRDDGEFHARWAATRKCEGCPHIYYPLNSALPSCRLRDDLDMFHEQDAYCLARQKLMDARQRAADEKRKMEQEHLILNGHIEEAMHPNEADR